MLFVNMPLLSSTDLHRIFEKLDTNCDGFVSLEELNWVLQRIGSNNNSQFSLDELESLVEKKSLDFNEFLFFYNSISKQNNGENKGGGDDDELERDLVKTFKVFDLDGDGFITSQELECVLKRLGFLDERSGKDCRSMIRFYDTNLDGRLDFQEFKNMMLLTST
ncbi:probable calcium-binding protein CML44 [Trifolium pratense]|uniref:probable calcium-binding protein CML44 n=1 Tax=Trifolium pratense TaxID=57577 RepID=UPI001E693125|nr:probable calcium-binding protein CML44 [Trifolium pratense]XP_045816176.1 probable calcium-binding protein CML44 [Trifolium pratense]